MAIDPTRVGRGNEDTPFEQDIAATAATFNLRIPSSTTFPGGDAFIWQVFIPNVGGNVLVRIGNNNTPMDGDININGMANTGGRVTEDVRDTIRLAIDADSRFSAVEGTNSQDIFITHVSLGQVNDPTINVFGNTGLANVEARDIYDGTDALVVEETQYFFKGPFTNVAPDRGIIQALANAAQNYEVFLSGAAAATTDTNFVNIADGLVGALATDFPTSVDGVTRPASAARKIPVKGSRRNAAGLAGRGTKDLSFTFTNETANRSIRQLILRIFDSFIDFADFLIADPAATIAQVNTFASAARREYNIEIGELERSVGPGGLAYENTVVDRSSDQGLLLNSDNLADIVNNFGSITDFATFKTQIIAAATEARRMKLRLKN